MIDFLFYAKMTLQYT